VADPDFNESAWRRAISSTGAIYGSTTFQLALGLVTIIVGSFAVLLGDGSTKDQIASAIFITASGVALVLLLVFAVQLALAPTHQRNELRRNWPGAVVEEPPNVELTLRNFSRIGDDLVKRITGYGGYVDSDDRELAENWTQDVVHFLSRRKGSQRFGTN